MGIKGLSKLIKDCKSTGVYKKIPLSIFSGSYVAIDVTGIGCVLMAAAHAAVVKQTNWGKNDLDLEAIKQEWIGLFLNRISDFLALHITPIFIFDGEPRPEKANVRAHRLKTRLALVEEAKKHQAQMEQMSNQDRFTYSKTSEFESLMKRNWRMGEEHVTLLKNLITRLGLPWLQAKYDAEQLGALLVKEEYARALYSEDSDALTFGANVVIHKIKDFVIDEQGRRVPSCVVWRRDQILADLQLSEESFLDLCVMCGCDYNSPDGKSSPIFGISQARAWALIKRYGTIEQLPQITPGFLDPFESRQLAPCGRLSLTAKYDLNLLAHNECRRIFQDGPAKDLIVTGTVLLTDYSLDSLRAFLTERRLNYENLDHIDNVRNALSIAG